MIGAPVQNSVKVLTDLLKQEKNHCLDNFAKNEEKTCNSRK